MKYIKNIFKDTKTMFFLLVFTVVMIIVAVNKIRKKKKDKAVEKVSEVLGTNLESDKNFKRDAETLKDWLGIDTISYIPNVFTQMFNGHDEDIVGLLKQYNKYEFLALSGVYKELYNRALLDDLDVGLSPLEFNKIKNIFY